MDILQFEDREFSNFQITSLKILARLARYEEIDDIIIDYLRDLELEYDSLLKKYEISEEKSNIDCKTTLLKYNEDLLVNIVKSISRFWQKSQREPVLPVSYIRVDLDDFSRINNCYGHETGDTVLKNVAETLKKTLRPTDYIFRFGGEEFDIVLPVTPIDGAVVFLEKAVRTLEELSISISAQEKVKITASMGVSSFTVDLSPAKRTSPEEIMALYRKVQKQADYACYEAKYRGKSRFCLYNEGTNYVEMMRNYSSQKARESF